MTYNLKGHVIHAVGGDIRTENTWRNSL